MSPPNVDSTMNLLRARSTLIACVCLLAASPALSQTVRGLADSGWVNQRIVMLKGMGEVHNPSDSTRLATAVGINLVAPISRREGRRLWITSTSGARGLLGVAGRCATNGQLAGASKRMEQAVAVAGAGRSYRQEGQGEMEEYERVRGARGGGPR